MIYLCSAFSKTVLTMKKTLPFLLVILMVGLIISCHKEPQPNNEPTFDSITFGDYEGMDVFTFDSIEWEYIDNEDMAFILYEGGFDVNGKSVGLRTLLSHSPGFCMPGDPLNYYTIGIYSDDLAFHFQTVSNDVFYHADSTAIQTDSVTLVYIDGISSCTQISESDQFERSYQINVLVQHNKNETLDKNDSYKNSLSWGSFYIPLFNSNEEYPYVTVLDTTDIIVYQSYIYAAEECLCFPLDEPFFLGFKSSDENGERLGWLKLIIEPNVNGHYIPKPLEAAIQKEQNLNQ